MMGQNWGYLLRKWYCGKVIFSQCYIRILSSLWLCTLNKVSKLICCISMFYYPQQTNSSTCISIQYTMSNYESYLLTAWTAWTTWTARTASPGEKHLLNTTSVQLHHKAPPCMSSQYTNTQWCSLLNIAIQLLQG